MCPSNRDVHNVPRIVKQNQKVLNVASQGEPESENQEPHNIDQTNHKPETRS